MKKFLFSLIFLLVSYVGFSQKGLSYQAVILDPAKIEIPGQDISGQPLVNGDVWMKFSIFNGSTLQFEEVHKTKTDNYGLVNLLIGSVSSASFNSLVWDGSQKSLQVFVSFNQGGSYTKISDQKLNYNPYALFAETAGKLGGTLAISGGGTGATTAADARANLGLDQVNNTSDVAKPVSAATKAALDLKANVTDVNAGLAMKSNTTDVTAALALKANTADVNAALALKANEADVTSALDLKANTSNVNASLALKANASDVNTALALKADTTYVLAKVAAATIADADANSKGKIQLAGDLGGTADAPTVPGLALKANTTDVNTALDLKANTVDMTNALALKANGATVATSLNLKENAANKSLNVNSDGTSDVKYPSVKAVKDYVDARVQSGGGSSNVTDADANTKGIIQLAGDLGGTATAPTVPGLALKAYATDVTTLTATVNANTASITANSTAINSKAPIASPSFTGTVSAPIYASTPQTLTDASTIAWNPSLGLNASVTLGGNRTLSFTATPATGSYGTLVLTQDATGGRTITLPSTTNKVLGSTSSTTIDLSTAANAIDIVNFYYDGTNYYWNIGQGYGQTASSGSTNLASDVTGTLAVANGGTGATTAAAARTNLGLVIGTNVQAPLVAGTDYLAPNGSAANLTNFPTLNQNTTGNAATATLATTATTAINATTAGNITATSNTTLTSLANLTTVGTITTGTWSATAISVAKGGTGATTLSVNNVLLGNGTSALQTVAPGASGNVLTSDGTTWTSSAPSGGSGSGTAHTVGEVYDGGIVFYITTGGLHGLIVDTYIYDDTPEYMYSNVKNPLKHNTDKSGNLYTDWYIPTYQELTLLYNARSNSTIATLTNISPNVFMSSDYMKWTQASPYRCLNFSNGSVEWINGDWTRKVIAIRSF